ncbi:MAG: DegT/DnrJ/EryC1/StrS family aminotransferase [Lachnospiraceae bacterium]|nr:DegT/DnrJ/EryC1/StrS family aminotransferase [Lachnospiraceae bacterium]
MDDKILVTRSSLPPFEDYIEEIRSIWDNHWLTNMGEKHERLREELRRYLEVDNIELFTNGHSAIELSLQAFSLKGEVITTPFTFASTTHAIVRCGLTPVFCDIDPITYTMDTGKLEGLITGNTCAILPVHVYGNLCNVEEIDRISKKYGLKVIYDAAHAFGVKYKGRGAGTFGDASCFSFHATKVFNTIEGGAVCYSDKETEFGEKVYLLKDFGISKSDEVKASGANAKLNEFCAAMGLCNLRYLDGELEKRRKVCERYNMNLSGIRGLVLNKPRKDVSANYSYYPVVFEEKEFGIGRDVAFEALKENGIFCRKYFYPATNAFECYREKFDPSETPVARDISERVLTLPLYADLELSEVDRICEVLLKARERSTG